MLRTLFVLSLISICLGGCSRCSGPSEVSAPEVDPPPVAVKSARDADLEVIVRVAGQADQVERQVLWVVAEERRNAPRSPFGKVLRAALMALDGKLATKGLFECENYTFNKSGGPGAWTFEFGENCGGRDGSKFIATWRSTSPKTAQVDFIPAHLHEVVGLNASALGRRRTCQVTWNEKGVLDFLSCPGWEVDRGEQLLRLTTMEFRRDRQNLMTLKGQVLESLHPVRKIDARVPLEGVISVTETELVAPAQPPEPPEPPPTAGPAEAVPPPESEAPPTVVGEPIPMERGSIDFEGENDGTSEPPILDGAPLVDSQPEPDYIPAESVPGTSEGEMGDGQEGEIDGGEEPKVIRSR